MMLLFLKIIFWLPLQILLPTIFINRKHLKQTGSCIYAANHQSWLDSVILALNLKLSVYFMAKKEIFKNKLTGAFLKSLHAFPVDRRNLDMKSIRTVKKLFDNKKSLALYPQGTRKKMADDFAGMKNGAVFFAIKFKQPIIPMFFVKKPGFFRINKVIVGEAITFEEYYELKPTKEVLNKASEKLTEAFNKLKAVNNENKKHS